MLPMMNVGFVISPSYKFTFNDSGTSTNESASVVEITPNQIGKQDCVYEKSLK